MIKARFERHQLRFKRPSGTSRGVLRTKDSWYVELQDREGHTGIGECSIIEGLSLDDASQIDGQLTTFCQEPEKYLSNYRNAFHKFPAIQFAIEMAMQDLSNPEPFILYPSPFSDAQSGILINGLIWMGDKQYMFDQIKSKIDQGYQCIKLKIGAIDFEQELSLLSYIRSHFSPEDIELRVDANGAFSPVDALEKLNQLSEFELHSIEQPIRQGQTEKMAKLCQTTPLDIALDEELVGVSTIENKRRLLQDIMPQYIILKPSLLGGFKSSDEWIDIANELGIEWWITSALEANVGLNAISQWTFTKQSDMPQGLGTGMLYENNIESPLSLRGQYIHYDPNLEWANIFTS